ncbi:MAG TPA: hypothetical protein VFN33_08675 [Gaiellaceae bacterium]|nr:hypothetical protein [Gaiellaceae bacterium]
MTKAILGVGALIAVAVALAGCGGGGSASGTTSGTTAGVAGVRHAQGSGSFRAGIHGLAARVQTSVHEFQSGNLTGAVASGAPLLRQCQSIVNGKLSTQAGSARQQQAVVHMQVACNDMSRAASAGANGNTAKAKSLARQALQQAKLAARLSG